MCGAWKDLIQFMQKQRIAYKSFTVCSWNSKDDETEKESLVSRTI